MEYLRGFRALRNDPAAASKILTASAVLLVGSCIPLLPQVVLMGWTAVAMRRAVQGDMSVPPLRFDTSYLSKLIHAGFKGLLASMIWSIPFVVLVAVVMICFVAGGMVALRSFGETAGILAVVVFYPLMMVLSIVAQIPAQAALVRAELADDLQAGMKVGPVFDLAKKGARDFVVGSLVLALLSIPLAMLGMLLCGLGVIPVTVVLFYAQAHIRAQVYERYVAKGGEAVPIGPTHPDPLEGQGTAPTTF